ncbi:hypothetical protein CPB84DRAFT_1859294 [Gymnopilus junonius]|uniref:CxC6 like cysteine cluster associated with KDZ domain-containing protein n=1 Tax=Gymnopilus junonius TaxID=109634 RepID=A0A9P5TEA5_GYMJU|nr:hypothetical protein CPB84DRAFT_1859294 [Gymnopilus junonius]
MRASWAVGFGWRAPSGALLLLCWTPPFSRGINESMGPLFYGPKLACESQSHTRRSLTVDYLGIIPALTGEDADESAANTAQAREETHRRRREQTVAANSRNMNMEVDDQDVEMDSDPVKMIILDGIVMGPTHCSFDGCTDDLKNAHGGALCANHEIAVRVTLT